MEDNRLKHRLVGATVLVALGVIFIPMIVEMEPPNGTRLENAQLPPPPKIQLFSSEDDEKRALTPPPPPVAPPPNPEVPPPPIASTPPSPLPESSPPQPVESPPTPQPSPPPPPAARVNAYQTEIRDGASLSGQFTKAGVKADQVAAVLKLGAAAKGLENIQSGQKLWIKPSPEKELQELIYYGPGNKIYAHVVRRNGKLQIASNESALAILTNQPLSKKSERDKKEDKPEIKEARPKIDKTDTGKTLPTETTQAKSLTQKPPRPTESPSPPNPNSAHSGAWIVQIASLNREENARALIGNLRSKGFPAFLETIYEGNKKLWRVRIGPSTDHDEVNNLQSRLKKDAHLTGNVLPYP